MKTELDRAIKEHFKVEIPSGLDEREFCFRAGALWLLKEAERLSCKLIGPSKHVELIKLQRLFDPTAEVTTGEVTSKTRCTKCKALYDPRFSFCACGFREGLNK